MIEELDELTRLVSDVVELARGTRQRAARASVRLDQIVEEAVERARRRAPGLRFESELEPARGARRRASGSRGRSPICSTTPASGVLTAETVEVSLRAGVLSVRDHGPGFHEEDLPFVFDRFHRARDARSKPGPGLGLAIVRQAAEAHGGDAGPQTRRAAARCCGSASARPSRGGTPVRRIRTRSVTMGT